MAERQATGRPRRGERRLITRAQLLDAAERVFARDGLRGASVDAIALEAGYSTGAAAGLFVGSMSGWMRPPAAMHAPPGRAGDRDDCVTARA